MLPDFKKGFWGTWHVRGRLPCERPHLADQRHSGWAVKGWSQMWSCVKPHHPSPPGGSWQRSDWGSVQGLLILAEWLGMWQGKCWRKGVCGDAQGLGTGVDPGQGRRQEELQGPWWPPLTALPGLGDSLSLLSLSPWAVLASLLSHFLEGSGGGSEHLASGSLRRGLGKRLCGHSPIGGTPRGPSGGAPGCLSIFFLILASSVG